MKFLNFFVIYLYTIVFCINAMEHKKCNTLLNKCIYVLSQNLDLIEVVDESLDFGDCPTDIQYKILKHALQNPKQFKGDSRAVIGWADKIISELRLEPKAKQNITDYLSRPELQQLAQWYLNQMRTPEFIEHKQLTDEMIKGILQLTYLDGSVRFKIATELKDWYTIDLIQRIRLLSKMALTEDKQERKEALKSTIIQKISGLPSDISRSSALFGFACSETVCQNQINFYETILEKHKGINAHAALRHLRNKIYSLDSYSIPQYGVFE